MVFDPGTLCRSVKPVPGLRGRPAAIGAGTESKIALIPPLKLGGGASESA
jgi:hypothetical protein